MTTQDGGAQLTIEEILQKILPQGTVSIEALRAIYLELAPEIQSAQLIPLAQAILNTGDELQTVVDGLTAASKPAGMLSVFSRDLAKGNYRSAAQALAAGNFAAADEHLAAIEAHHLASPKADARLAAAQARAERAKVALLRTNPAAYRAAADHYLAAALIIQTAASDTAWKFRIEEGLTLIKLFEKFEDPNALMDAVGLFHTILEGPVPNSHERANAWSHIGDAMSLLGNYGNNPQVLKHAADAYREAIRTYSRDEVAFVWSVAQMQLGDVLLSLAEHESDTSSLEEAAAAYRSSLEVYDSAFAGTVRTSVLLKLADTLKLIAVRSGTTTAINEVIEVYRQAIDEFSDDDPPAQMAALQKGLEVALAMQKS